MCDNIIIAIASVSKQTLFDILILRIINEICCLKHITIVSTNSQSATASVVSCTEMCLWKRISNRLTVQTIGYLWGERSRVSRAALPSQRGKYDLSDGLDIYRPRRYRCSECHSAGKKGTDDSIQRFSNAELIWLTIDFLSIPFLGRVNLQRP